MEKLSGVDNEEIYHKFMMLSLHGQSKDALAKTQLGEWEYDIISPAYKCNMTDIMAAIGLGQLERYDDLLEKRRQLIEVYDNGLDGMCIDKLKHYTDTYTSSGHLYLTRIGGNSGAYRDLCIIKMAENGIACNVHYKPLPMHTAYKSLGFDMKDYPNAYKQFENEITLPLNSKMTLQDAEYVAETLKGIHK